MSERHHKPVRMAPWRLEASESEDDAIWRLHPERSLAIAHDTAWLLVGRGEAESDDGVSRQETLEKLNSFVDREGLDTLAELWSMADPVSLPGALWRLYQIRDQIHRRPDVMGDLVGRGIEALDTIDPIVVGASEPVTAEGVSAIIDEVLRGSFTGGLSEALVRASALARVIAAGLLHWPEPNDAAEHEAALKSLRWDVVAGELADCARREKTGELR